MAAERNTIDGGAPRPDLLAAGGANASAKLSETDVLAIRALQGVRLYGVSRGAIQHIRTGRTWKWLDGPELSGGTG